MTEQTPKKSIFAILQKIGQSLMIPVSVLPAAGLMVALGRVLENASVETITGTITSPLLHAISKILFSGGLAIFEQLPLVFSIGVAIGFTGGAGVAGLASAVGYFTLINVIKVVGAERGIQMAINTGVFGGIIVGLLSASMYQRFYQTRLHPVLGFFSGKRLVPIVTTGASILLGILLAFVWPPIQMQISAFGAYVMDSSLGPAFYAAGKRLLIPVGLHHVYYPPFLYEFGEFVTSAGQTIRGESARYFAGDTTAGRFMASEFPIMLFGLPAAALAMYMRAKTENKKMIAGVMLSAALTSIITGITEPIEFAFTFVAPLLFVFHVGVAFLSGLLTSSFEIQQGYTFSASVIDFFLGLFNAKNSVSLFFIVGPLVAALYFGVFYWAIGAFNLKTPGREELGEQTESMSVEASDKATAVLEALGGAGNIVHLDACITRLRTTVKNGAQVNKDRLKSLGAAGILDAGSGNFQVIFGVESDLLKEEIKSIIAAGPKTKITPDMIFKAPLSGKVLNLDQVPDETFAQKLVGDGFAIDPTDGIVRSPVDAEVVQVFRTNHAIGLLAANGVEILIHIGVDTVKMNGEGFKSHVKPGDKVKAGDKLLEFDLNIVRQKAKSTITPILITNMDKIQVLTRIAKATIGVQDELFSVKL